MLTRIVIILLLAVATTAPTQSTDGVEIDRHPASVEYVTIDPRHPPATMPAKKAGEDAWCRFAFDCTVKLKYDVVRRHVEPDGRVTVEAQLQQVRVTLTLADSIYLPKLRTEKLKAHEEGHHRINQRVYEADAERAARAAAAQVMSHTWTATADTEDAAGKLATDQAVQALGAAYLKAVADRAYAIGEAYDEVTDHGRRMKPTEDEAIEEAFGRW